MDDPPWLVVTQQEIEYWYELKDNDHHGSANVLSSNFLQLEKNTQKKCVSPLSRQWIEAWEKKSHKIYKKKHGLLLHHRIEKKTKAAWISLGVLHFNDQSERWPVRFLTEQDVTSFSHGLRNL